MKSSKLPASTTQERLELTSLPSPTLEIPIVDEKTTTIPAETSNLLDDSSRSTTTTMKSPPIHKMSAPSVTPIISTNNPSGRSRLSSFNLPIIFNSSSKPSMNFFSGHRRRGSLGKSLLKHSKLTKTDSSGGGQVENVETIIDMEEHSKTEVEAVAKAIADVQSTIADMATSSNQSIAAADSSSIDQRLIAAAPHPDRSDQPISKKLQQQQQRTRHVSESSGAGRVSLMDERQSKVSLTESGYRDLPPTGAILEHPSDDSSDLQRTERNLVTLLEDFSAGRLKAFSSSDTSMALRRVREMQERLARSHFDMYTFQARQGFDNVKLSTLCSSNWQSVMGGMQELTDAMHRLGTSSKSQLPLSNDPIGQSISTEAPPKSHNINHDSIPPAAL